VVLQLTNEPNQLVKAWTNYNILCSVWGSRSTSIELSHNQNTTTKLNNTQPLSSCEPCSCNPPTTCLTTWFYDQIASRRIMGLDYNWFTNRNTLCAAISRFSNRLVASFYVTKTLGLEHNKVDNEIALLGFDIE
jgi:hypothetical protein